MNHPFRWVSGLLIAIVLATGCAEDVGDIDRRQPNLLAKQDLSGTWYFRQTITEVPAQIDYAFVGYSSSMEKIRWDIRENFLIAYRAYEYEPGTDPGAGPVVRGETQIVDGEADAGFNPGDYQEQPIAAFRIISHIDVQRSYNPQTGEVQNVISENQSDRPWYDRGYVRVDWSFNHINSLDFFADMNRIADVGYFVQEGEGGPDAFYSERRQSTDGNDELGYFDFVNKLSLAPDLYDCWYFDLNCIPGEIKIRNSFSRLEQAERDYQPALYDDRSMNKFGYFRSMREIYDRREGFTDEKRLYFANRHDIWVNDYLKNEDGSYQRDARGQRIPTPMADRVPKPVVYYLSPNFPAELMSGVEAMEAEWDRAFTRAAAAGKGVSTDQLASDHGAMFVICNNPVTDDDHPACDPRSESERTEPFAPRIGDLRYSFFWWVDAPQAAGPLGYGPPFPDPETGEIISGTAYIYGASIDTYGQWGVDVVKLVNGDFDEGALRAGADVQEYLIDNLRGDIDPREAPAADVAEMPLEQVENLLSEKQQAKLGLLREHGPEELLDRSVNRHQQVMDRFRNAGFDHLLTDSEMVSRFTNGRAATTDQLDDDETRRMFEQFNPLKLRDTLLRRHRFQREAARKTIYLADHADPAVIATALEYKDLPYDEVWDRVRSNIVLGVGTHEIGHSIGLRHNFQGSYDAINYFDDYWDLRAQNLPGGPPQTIGDFYRLSEQTQEQIDAGMRKKQYSSIMDYHSRFDGDWSGVGKYDEAAILFAYTFGTYDSLDTSNEDPIVPERGFVEVFDNLPPQAEDLVRSYDNRGSPAARNLLENFHYSTVIARMGNDPSVLRERSLVKYEDLEPQIAAQEPDRPVEVPYMFCSDELAGALISCQRWDLGADPMEIVQTAEDDYFTYYPLTHFRRQRTDFDPIGPLNRSYRTMLTMLTVYQQWLLGFSETEDDLLDTYYLIAAGTGFNVVARTMSMPRYGVYEENDEGVWEWIDYEAEPGPDNRQIAMGEGRRLRSLYDAQSGYYYFDRLLESGHFWDWLGALLVAIEPVARTVAVDTAADREAFLLPYYLLFEDELTELFNGQITDDLGAATPRILSDGSIEQSPLFRLNVGVGQFVDPADGSPISFDGDRIQVEANLTQNRYSALYGVAFFNELYTNHFVDQARVFKMGNGEQIEAGTGYEVYSFTDPNTGLEYGTVRPTGGAAEPSLGETLVTRGRDLAARVEAGDQDAEFQLDNLVGSVNLLSQIVEVYGGVD